VVLPSEPPLERMAAAGGVQPVPILLGTNRDEQKTFLYANPEWVSRPGKGQAKMRDAALYNAAAQVISAAWRVMGTDAPASALWESGRRDVYAYRFDWDEQPSAPNADLAALIGAGHGFEIPFVFGYWDLGPLGTGAFTDQNRPGRDELASAVMSYWAEFARSGKPGKGRRGELPDWQAWDGSAPEAPKFMLLDTRAGGGLRMSSEVTQAADVSELAGSLAAIRQSPARCAVYGELALRLGDLYQAPAGSEAFCSKARSADAKRGSE